jgi:NAD(P)-dependent dehydrogenase (short-subunit alcohol dehydrogenase family)
MTDGAALVTDGAGRIGRAISLALHRTGYAVAIHALHAAGEAETLRDEIVRAGGRACVVPADLGDQAVVELVAAAAAALGPLSLLVNNAVRFAPDEIDALDAAGFDRQFAVNLRAPLLLAHAFARRGGEGAVVNIVDQPGKPAADAVAYTLSRSTLRAATATLAQALAPRVRVNAVTCADPLRPLDPEEIAAAVVYLSRARSVTGVTLAVGGSVPE